MTRVRNLPRDPGPAAWNRLLPEPDAPSPLEGTALSDWLVIGAGFAGLTAAHRLAHACPGDRIAVLDATRVGDGPAGRNSGFMIDLPHDLTSDDYGGAPDGDRAQVEDNRAAIAYARAIVEEYGIPPEAFAPVGKTNAAAGPAGDRHNREFASHLKALGEPSEWLDAAAMREMTGTDYYTSGLYTPGTVILQPAMYVRGIARGLRSNRIRIHEMSPVTDLKRVEGVWTATTPGGRISAPRVILAVNGHLQSFGYLPGRLVHVHTYASMTRALSGDEISRLGGARVWGVTPADPLGSTVRRISGTGGDRIVVRNRFTFDPALGVPDGRIDRVARDHDRAFAARFPMLRGVEMEYRWGGRLCLSRNNVQVIGELDEGLYSACCQNGLGTAKGTLAGLLAADLATGRDSPALDRARGAPAPGRLPPAPLAKLGATARIRWGEMRAGREL